MWEKLSRFCILSSKRNIFPLLEWKIGHGGLLTAHIKFFPCQYQIQDTRAKNTILSDISEYSKSPVPVSMNALLFCWMSIKRFMAHILLNGLYRMLSFKDTKCFTKSWNSSRTSSVLGLILHCLSTIALQSPPTVDLNAPRLSVKPQAEVYFPNRLPAENITAPSSFVSDLCQRLSSQHCQQRRDHTRDL